MSQPEAVSKYIFTFLKEGENENKYRFMLTLGKQLDKQLGDKLIAAIGSLGGIDGFQPIGRYTVEIVIARTFNADDVIAELRRRLDEEVLSDIIRPPSNLTLVK